MLFRGSTSNRPMGCVNGRTPNIGLGGAPVGMVESTWAEAYGLNPRIGASRPALVKSPIFKRSRRESWPWDNPLTISNRFFLAFSASRSRAFDALHGR